MTVDFAELVLTSRCRHSISLHLSVLFLGHKLKRISIAKKGVTPTYFDIKSSFFCVADVS